MTKNTSRPAASAPPKEPKKDRLAKALQKNIQRRKRAPRPAAAKE